MKIKEKDAYIETMKIEFIEKFKAFDNRQNVLEKKEETKNNKDKVSNENQVEIEAPLMTEYSDKWIELMKKEDKKKENKIKNIELKLKEKEHEIIQLWDEKYELDRVIFGKNIVINDLLGKDCSEDSDSDDIQDDDETVESPEGITIASESRKCDSYI